MYLKFKDDETIFTQISYNRDKKFFILTSNNGVSLECENCLNLEEEKTDDYCFVILNSKVLNKENDIYQVFDKKENIRLGWIFPIQALLSDEHDYAENIFFLRYAYVAISLLLNSIKEENQRDSSEVIKLSDFFQEDFIILVLCQSNCNKISNFIIQDYIVDLFSYGYSFTPYDYNVNKVIEVDKCVRLSRISNDIRDKTFIIEVFQSLLVQTSLFPLAKFHILYQLVELLIADIFTYEFAGFIQKMNMDTNNLFDLKDDLQKLTGEKYRVRELFNTYSHINSEVKESLMSVCNKLLEQSDKKTKVEVGDSLYSVRCLIFHNYVSIPVESRKIIEEINDFFEGIVSELLITFHLPCLG